MKNKVYLTAFLCALLISATPAHAKKPAVLASPQVVPSFELDRTDLTRIEEYLNELSTLQAEFSQTNDNGEYRHGTLMLKRPGKMRVTYDAPSKDFIVADGHFINFWDGQLQQQSSVPIDSSLGDILLRDKIAFSGDVTVTKIERAPAKIEITVAQTQDVGAGQLSFVFEDRPLKLRGWHILDAQGRITSVNLENANEHASFSSGVFTFTPPNFGKGHKNGGL